MKPIRVEQDEAWNLKQSRIDIKTTEEEEEAWQNLEKSADFSAELEEKESWSNLQNKASASKNLDTDGEAVEEDQDKAV